MQILEYRLHILVQSLKILLKSKLVLCKPQFLPMYINYLIALCMSHLLIRQSISLLVQQLINLTNDSMYQLRFISSYMISVCSKISDVHMTSMDITPLPFSRKCGGIDKKDKWQLGLDMPPAKKEWMEVLLLRSERGMSRATALLHNQHSVIW